MYLFCPFAVHVTNLTAPLRLQGKNVIDFIVRTLDNDPVRLLIPLRLQPLSSLSPIACRMSM